MSSSDDDEDDTTPLCELKGVQAAKTAKTAAAAFKEKCEHSYLKLRYCDRSRSSSRTREWI